MGVLADERPSEIPLAIPCGTPVEFYAQDGMEDEAQEIEADLEANDTEMIGILGSTQDEMVGRMMERLGVREEIGAIEHSVSAIHCPPRVTAELK